MAEVFCIFCGSKLDQFNLGNYECTECDEVE